MEQRTPPERVRPKPWLRVPVIAAAWVAWTAFVLAAPGRVAAVAGPAAAALTALTVVALWRLGPGRAP